MLACLAGTEHLRLVLDRLEEDDALCAALCCTSMRDAVRARFPNGIRTRVDSACLRPERTAWAAGLGDGHAPPIAGLFATAARHNRRSAMRELSKLGFEPDSLALSEAARRGSLASVEWLLLQAGLTPGPRDVEAAVEGGQTRIIDRFLAIHGVCWDADAYVAAVRRGDLDCLRLLMDADDNDELCAGYGGMALAPDKPAEQPSEAVEEHAQPHTPAPAAREPHALPPHAPRGLTHRLPSQAHDAPAAAAAVATPHPNLSDVLLGPISSFVRARRRRTPAPTPPPPTGQPAPARSQQQPIAHPPPVTAAPPPAAQAAPADGPNVGQQARAQPAPQPLAQRRRWDERAAEAAAAEGHIEVLHTLLVCGAPCTWRAMRAAARNGDVRTIDLLAQRGCEWRAHATEIADAAGDHADVLRWLEMHQH